MSNRAERRKAERSMRAGSMAYQVTFDDLKRIHQEAIDNVTMQVLPRMLLASMEVLHTKFGYGKTRLKRFAEGVFNIYDAVDKRYVTLDEIAKAIDEATGITIKSKSKNQYSVDTGDAK